MYWLKQKKVVILIGVMVLLGVLFLLKNKTIFKNQAQNSGLVYDGTETVEGLVNKDTDGDTIPDWEEGLYGTDPLKKQTTPGVSDSTYIENRKRQVVVDGELNLNAAEEEHLTETDKLARELFSSVAALNQAGGVDDGTVDTLTTELAQKLQNPTQRKVFTRGDLKIVKNEASQTIKNYNDHLNKIFDAHPMPYTVLDVLSKFIIDENTVDESVLRELDPLTEQANKIITDMAKMDVPESLAELHLEMLNGLEKVTENISDIRKYDSDIIVAVSGLSQYQTNTDKVGQAGANLMQAINNKLNN